MIKFCLLKFLGAFPIFKNDCVQHYVNISTKKCLSDNYKPSNIKKWNWIGHPTCENIAKMKLNLKRCNICDLTWLFSLLLVKSEDSFTKHLIFCTS